MFSQVHDKIIESGKFVMERRRKVTFGVRDLDQIQVEHGQRISRESIF
jgi:hypothetical protein